MANSTQAHTKMRFTSANDTPMKDDLWWEDERFDSFKKMYLDTCYDGEGKEIEDGMFELFGRWNYKSNVHFDSMLSALNELKTISNNHDLDIQTMIIDYSDMDTQDGWYGWGRIKIDVHAPQRKHFSEVTHILEEIGVWHSLDELVEQHNLYPMDKTFPEYTEDQEELVTLYRNYIEDYLVQIVKEEKVMDAIDRTLPVDSRKKTKENYMETTIKEILRKKRIENPDIAIEIYSCEEEMYEMTLEDFDDTSFTEEGLKEFDDVLQAKVDTSKDVNIIDGILRIGVEGISAKRIAKLVHAHVGNVSEEKWDLWFKHFDLDTQTTQAISDDQIER